MTRSNIVTSIDTTASEHEQAAVRIPRRHRQQRSRDRRDAGSNADARTQAHPATAEPSGHDTIAVETVAATRTLPVSSADSAAEAPTIVQIHDAKLTDIPDDDDIALPEDPPTTQAILSPEMKSAFLQFRKSQLAQRSSRVALAMSKLMRIRLPYPRQIEGMAEIEELRLLGLEMKGQQQLALTVFERTGTGKSTLAQQYKLMRNEEAAEGTTSVLHARLGTSGTARDLYVSIMSELGDGFSTSGTEHTLRRRAIYAMEQAGVELLILDETQHSGQKSGFSKEVTAELKIMLDTGKVPIVLLGTEAAIPLIGGDRELAGRMFSPCRLAPLDMTDDDDFDLWRGFLTGLDARMVAENIVAAPAGLSDRGLAEALGEACDGIIGQLMRVML